MRRDLIFGNRLSHSLHLHGASYSSEARASRRKTFQCKVACSGRVPEDFGVIFIIVHQIRQLVIGCFYLAVISKTSVDS